MNYYDRYSDFRTNSTMVTIPGITIPISSTDKTVVYKKRKTRLDKLSNSYYNTPYCGWLIMQANQEYGGLEFLIPDQSILRVPYPFESAIDRLTIAINTQITLYGQ